MMAKQRVMFIVMLFLVICFRGSNQQDTEWLSPQNAFEFLAGNETYFEDVPDDVVKSYFFLGFEGMLWRKIPGTGQWLFSSSREIQRQQVALLDELGESMDGSDIPKSHEIEILTEFKQYLENWIGLLKEHGQ